MEGGFYNVWSSRISRMASRRIVKVQKYKGFLKVLKFELRNVVLKLINYSCNQKPINDLHLGQVDESWYPNETPPGFHLRWNMFFIRDQTFLIVSFEKTCQKLGLRASSQVPKTPRNRWKHEACSLVLSPVSRCFEPAMKHSPSVLTYYLKIGSKNQCLNCLQL